MSLNVLTRRRSIYRDVLLCTVSGIAFTYAMDLPRVVKKTLLGFGMPILRPEGGALIGGAPAEATVWLDHVGVIHVHQYAYAPGSVKRQVAREIERLQGFSWRLG